MLFFTTEDIKASELTDDDIFTFQSRPSELLICCGARDLLHGVWEILAHVVAQEVNGYYRFNWSRRSWTPELDANRIGIAEDAPVMRVKIGVTHRIGATAEALRSDPGYTSERGARLAGDVAASAERERLLFRRRVLRHSDSDETTPAVAAHEAAHSAGALAWAFLPMFAGHGVPCAEDVLAYPHELPEVGLASIAPEMMEAPIYRGYEDGSTVRTGHTLPLSDADKLRQRYGITEAPEPALDNDAIEQDFWRMLIRQPSDTIAFWHWITGLPANEVTGVLRLRPSTLVESRRAEMIAWITSRFPWLVVTFDAPEKD